MYKHVYLKELLAAISIIVSVCFIVPSNRPLWSSAVSAPARFVDGFERLPSAPGVSGTFVTAWFSSRLVVIMSCEWLIVVNSGQSWLIVVNNGYEWWIVVSSGQSWLIGYKWLIVVNSGQWWLIMVLEWLIVVNSG